MQGLGPGAARCVLGEYDGRPDRSRSQLSLLSLLRHPKPIRTRGTHPARERGGRVQHLWRPPRGAQSSVRTKITRVSAIVGAQSSVRTKFTRASPARVVGARVSRGVSLPSEWSRQARPAGPEWSRQARPAGQEWSRQARPAPGPRRWRHL